MYAGDIDRKGHTAHAIKRKPYSASRRRIPTPLENQPALLTARKGIARMSVRTWTKKCGEADNEQMNENLLSLPPALPIKQILAACSQATGFPSRRREGGIPERRSLYRQRQRPEYRPLSAEAWAKLQQSIAAFHEYQARQRRRYGERHAGKADGNSFQSTIQEKTPPTDKTQGLSEEVIQRHRQQLREDENWTPPLAIGRPLGDDLSEWQLVNRTVMQWEAILAHNLARNADSGSLRGVLEQLRLARKELDELPISKETTTPM